MIDFDFAQRACLFFKQPQTRKTHVQLARLLGIRPASVAVYLRGVHEMPANVRAGLEKLMADLAEAPQAMVGSQV